MNENEIKTGVGGFLLFIEIILILNFFVNLLAVIVAINNYGLATGIAVGLFAAFCLAAAVCIKRKKKIAKNMVIILSGLQILSNSFMVMQKIAGGDFYMPFPFCLKIIFDFAIITYFVKSQRVKNTLTE